MTMNNSRETAKIYQFPKTPRARFGGYSKVSGSDLDYASAQIANTAPGGAWYHDEAIAAEADLLGKH